MDVLSYLWDPQSSLMVTTFICLRHLWTSTNKVLFSLYISVERGWTVTNYWIYILTLTVRYVTVPISHWGKHTGLQRLSKTRESVEQKARPYFGVYSITKVGVIVYAFFFSRVSAHSSPVFLFTSVVEGWIVLCHWGTSGMWVKWIKHTQVLCVFNCPWKSRLKGRRVIP